MRRALALTLAVLAGAWLAWPREPASEGVSETAPAPASLRLAASARETSAAPSGVPWMSELAPAASEPAWRSMAEARLHGDPRTPPLAPQMARMAPASPQLLADPQAYLAQESGRDAQVLAAFAAAAQSEVPRLRADVARARAQGLPEAQIAKVEAKIARIEKLRQEIQQTGKIAN